MKMFLLMGSLLLSSHLYSRSITITSPLPSEVIPGNQSSVTIRGEVDSVAGGAGVVTCNGKSANFYSGTKWIRAVPVNVDGLFLINCSYVKDNISAAETIELYHEGQIAKPVPSFTTSLNLNTATFNGTGSTSTNGAITDYRWNFGDGVSATGPTVSHNYSAPGEYWVNLVVRDQAGFLRGSSKKIVINNIPAPTFKTIRRLNGQFSVDFDATPLGATSGLSYEWSFGDGQTQISSNPIVNHQFLTSGTYNLSLVIKNGSQILNQVNKVYEIFPLGIAIISNDILRNLQSYNITFNEAIVNTSSIAGYIDGNPVSLNRMNSKKIFHIFSDLSIGAHTLSFVLNQKEFVFNFLVNSISNVASPEIYINSRLEEIENKLQEIEPYLSQSNLQEYQTSMQNLRDNLENMSSIDKQEVANFLNENLTFPTELNFPTANKSVYSEDNIDKAAKNIQTAAFGTLTALAGLGMVGLLPAKLKPIGWVFVAVGTIIASFPQALSAEIQSIQILNSVYGLNGLGSDIQSGTRYPFNFIGLYRKLDKTDYNSNPTPLIKEFNEYLDIMKGYNQERGTNHPIHDYSVLEPSGLSYGVVPPKYTSLLSTNGVTVVPPFVNGEINEFECSFSSASWIQFPWTMKYSHGSVVNSELISTWNTKCHK